MEDAKSHGYVIATKRYTNLLYSSREPLLPGTAYTLARFEKQENMLTALS